MDERGPDFLASAVVVLAPAELRVLDGHKRFLSGREAGTCPPSERHTRAAVRCGRPRRGGSAGKSPPIPRSGAHGRRHLEIRVGVDQPRLLSRFEDGPQPVATGSHDPCPIALEDIGVGAVLEHGANQRQPPRSGHPSLKVGQFGDQRGERIIGGGRRIGAVGHGGHHGGGQTGLVRPAPIEGLAARVRLFGHRRQGHAS